MIKSPAIFERPYEKERSNRKSILVVVRSLIEDFFPFNCYHSCIFIVIIFFLDPDNRIGLRETRL